MWRSGPAMTVCLGFVCGSAFALDDRPDPVRQHLEDARRSAWTIASAIAENMAPGDGNGDFPALRTFADEVGNARARAFSRGQGAPPNPIDANALVSRNPRFWRANYEVAPGDPSWMLLHASLLLAGDEALRAEAVLTLARAEREEPKSLRKSFGAIFRAADRVLDDGNKAVQSGISLYDRGDRTKAFAAYRKALLSWPQNGWASYELGLTMMTEPREDRIKKTKTVAGHTLAVLDAFERARSHDPFQLGAYQGEPNVAGPRLTALREKVLPVWQKLNKPGAHISDAELLTFSEGCQHAGIDELALVARQLVVIHRGRYRPDDHPFITKSLRRVAPGDETEAALRGLAGSKLKFRRLVEPE
jgi:hypothetical protein